MTTVDLPSGEQVGRGSVLQRKGVGRLSRAMEEMGSAVMYLCGITPQEAARRREVGLEEEEREEQEASQSKVSAWMKTVACS